LTRKAATFGETPRRYFVHTVATVEEMRAELARLAGKMR
jgi:hypothetical protein